MSEELTIYGFETSNNMKVRVALGFKGIPYLFRAIDPKDRAEVERLSGQPLTPVMVHGPTVLFDSSAILRYLDGNFPDTPRLFPGDSESMHTVEAWERFGRGELHDPLRMMVRMRVSGDDDPALRQRAAELFASATVRIEERLADNRWLCHHHLSAADVCTAPVVRRIEIADFFEFPGDRPRMREWVDRVMAYDARS